MTPCATQSLPLFTMALIAVGLAMDAFAVAMASGVMIRRQRHYHALRAAVSFATFQMVMPVLGWSSGIYFRSYLSGIDHWVAFGILVGVGGKMLYEALKFEAIERSDVSMTLCVLLGLSVATSVDALAVGLSFAVLNISIVLPVLVIGVITLMLSYLGFWLGNRYGHLFENKVEIVGGLMLIGIGFKVLVDHLR